MSILLLTGMPGAGKTTMTDLVARRLPRAARLSGDVVSRLIVSGRVGFQQEPAEESARQAELCLRNLATLAANFADAGITALVDTVVPDRAPLDLFAGLVAPRPLRLVVLAPGIDACKHRNSIRDPRERFDFDGYDELDARMRGDFGDRGWWFDTSTLDAETTADRIVAESGARAVLRTDDAPRTPCTARRSTSV
ncbi:AAA family ATPase [Phytomonospora endophytica]|uniref:Adenylate kinase n=1 Tax=Phytomonospora endophytica TaxID=714109 RepID=A0A841FVV6_9ACTN|nr:AAA family ATPase [Phytomonospora endophytica]MBB6038893.1 adenylate kinase [Phytomonospora endophytica]GIG71557.1 hypothetical protein Pen01_78520 [Phytomonospora endophytica]